MRASDADRFEVADRLRIATAEGRLTAAELEERLDTLYTTKTYGELEALVADLPSTATATSTSTALVRRKRHLPVWAIPAGAAAALLFAIGAVLAEGVRRAGTVAVGAHPRGALRIVPPLDAAHRGLVLAGSAASLLAIMLVCAAIAWALTHLRRPRNI